jgi:hypothetical protein
MSEQPIDDLMGNPVTQIEIESEPDDGVEFEIVDARPEEDQVLPRVGEEPDFTEFDSEIEGVDKKVKKRINRLRYEFHEQRRAKDTAVRERDEALKYAQSLQDLVKRGEEVLVGQLKAKNDVELEKAREEAKSAFEEGDAEGFTKAQENLHRVTYEGMVANSYVPGSGQNQFDGDLPNGEAPQQQQEVDQYALQWKSNNPWYGKDPALTGYALSVHNELINSGVDPVANRDEYYGTINSRVRGQFPDKFGDVEQGPPGATARQSRQSVVAPAKRTSGNRRKVRLTEDQVNLAKRLGVPLEEYARQMNLLQGDN